MKYDQKLKDLESERKEYMLNEKLADERHKNIQEEKSRMEDHF